MTDKEFLYSMYDADLVDYAMDSTKDFYRKETFEADLKLSTIVEENGGRPSGERMYKHVSDQLVYAFLHGASYAVKNELTSTAPSEETFSEFHKNVDFAVLFDFGDNDFGLAIEAGAKAFCDEFNSILRQIDIYNDHEYSRDNYIKEFNELCKVKNIKEVMKCGFMAARMRNSAEVICGMMPNAANALTSLKSDLDYIHWDGIRTKWEKVGEEYVESEAMPRFITGTLQVISDALKKYGDPFENDKQEFPVWCNGEVVILYMKNGYLTYLTR